MLHCFWMFCRICFWAFYCSLDACNSIPLATGKSAPQWTVSFCSSTICQQSPLADKLTSSEQFMSFFSLKNPRSVQSYGGSLALTAATQLCQRGYWCVPLFTAFSLVSSVFVWHSRVRLPCVGASLIPVGIGWSVVSTGCTMADIRAKRGSITLLPIQVTSRKVSSQRLRCHVLCK